MKRSLDEWFNVTEAEVVGDSAIRITFDDGFVRTIDFANVLYGPVFDALRDPAEFRKVTVDPGSGTIEWPTGANFNPVVLHDWPDYVEELEEVSKHFMPGATPVDWSDFDALIDPAGRPLDEWFDVVAFEITDDYTLRLTFDDGFEREIDFEPVLHGAVFEPLRDPALFAKVILNRDSGTVEWPTGADFNPVVLHDWPVYVDAIIARKAKHLERSSDVRFEAAL